MEFISDDRWQKELIETKKITDCSGKEIDLRILECVTTFRCLEFPTSMSCGGHLENVSSFPYIEIMYPENTEFGKARRAWVLRNLAVQNKALHLLSEFYKERKTSYNAMLTVVPFLDCGWFRVMNHAGAVLRLAPAKERASLLELYRNEFDEFSDFMRRK